MSSSSSSSYSSPPPWEALQILGPYIDDPKTLATASCVSSSWRAAFSADHLWARICSSSYPSLSALHLGSNPSSRPRALFSALRSAKRRRRRLRGPPKPRLALRDLIFTLDVYRCTGGGDGESLLSFAKPGDELVLKSGGIFLFEVDLTAGGNAVNCREEMKVVWTAVKMGCDCGDVGGDVGAFSMMECAGKGRAVGGSGLWFAEKLPGPPCCSIAAEAGGAEAEVGMGLGAGDGDQRVVERVSLGLLSGASCRYVGLDDGLLYLQHFLLL